MKKLISVLLTVLLLFSTVPSVFAANLDNVNISIDGVVLPEKGVLWNGTTMVPMRSVLERLGFIIRWDESKQEIQALKADLRLTLNLYSTTGTSVSGGGTTPIYLTQAPNNFNGSTFVPLRFIAEAGGLEVSWDKTTSTAIIDNNLPTLLVHGFNGGFNTFKTMSDSLELEYSDTLDIVHVKVDGSLYIEKEAEIHGKNPIIVVVFDNSVDTLAAGVNGLQKVISYELDRYATTKVNVVAHSFGGIVTTKYIVDNPTNNYINKFMTLASPIGGVKYVKVVNPKTSPLLTLSPSSLVSSFWYGMLPDTTLDDLDVLKSKDLKGVLSKLKDGKFDKSIQVISLAGKFDTKIAPKKTALLLGDFISNIRTGEVPTDHSGIHEQGFITALIKTFMKNDLQSSEVTKYLEDAVRLRGGAGNLGM
jgi:pimeloyl-ACP methyl ester carboxylesterase